VSGLDQFPRIRLGQVRQIDVKRGGDAKTALGARTNAYRRRHGRALRTFDLRPG
jgi:hypothetical protein